MLIIRVLLLTRYYYLQSGPGEVAGVVVEARGSRSALGVAERGFGVRLPVGPEELGLGLRVRFHSIGTVDMALVTAPNSRT